MCSDDQSSSLDYVDLPGGWTVGRIPLLHNLPTIRHAISTRVGPHGGDLHGGSPTGLANRQGLAAAMGLEQCAALKQVHGGRVVDADLALAGLVEADGLMTGREGVGLMGLSADCPIILVADVVRGAVGMAHASWRGTVARITAELVSSMCREYRCEPGDMQAGICPSAGACCYEVREDVISAARQTLGPGADGFFCQRQGRTYMDLWRANVAQLTEQGVSEHNIAVAGVCTICDSHFFSYRREGAKAGRFGCIIARA